jgi:hypothetical protein
MYMLCYRLKLAFAPEIVTRKLGCSEYLNLVLLGRHTQWQACPPHLPLATVEASQCDTTLPFNYAVPLIQSTTMELGLGL